MPNSWIFFYLCQFLADIRKKRTWDHVTNYCRDEELLRQGLTLNDDLERVLAKHDAISLGTAAQRDKGKSLETLVDIGDTNNRQSDQRYPLNLLASTSFLLRHNNYSVQDSLWSPVWDLNIHYCNIS